MEFLQPLVSTIEHLGMLGYWLVFIVSFFETLVFIGSIIPGATLVVLAGFFSMQGYLDIGDLVFFAATGTMFGGIISYYLGTKGTHFFRREPSLLAINHLEKAEHFFNNKGNTSIVFAQFSGSIRSVVPFVAGLKRMDIRLFLLWSILGSTAWAAAYLLAGYFFGAVITIIESWSTRAGVFFLVLCALSIILWFFIRRIAPLFSFFISLIRSIIEGISANTDIRRFAARHPITAHFIKQRFNKKNFSGLPLTVIGTAFIYIASLFLGITQGIISSVPVILADSRVAHLALAFRDAEFIRVFTWVTLLGKWEIVVSTTAIFSGILWLWKKQKYIVPLLVTLIGTEGFVTLGKIVFHRARPEGAVYFESSYSFPSGHAAIAVALYGFIAYIVFRETKKTRYKINAVFISLLFISLIGTSRLYLGVHFLSDVWGGYLLGALWLLVGVAVVEWMHYHRYVLLPTPTRIARVTIIGLMVLEILFFSGFGMYYNPPVAGGKMEQTIAKTHDILTFFNDTSLSRFTETLSGQTQEPLSMIVVAKNDRQFIDVMKKAGWLLADPPTIASISHLAQAAITGESYPAAPMTPSFWDTRVHDFGFEKPTSANNVRARHHTRFWRTEIMTENDEQIYVGTASEDSGIKWFITHQIKPDIDTERELLFSDIFATGDVDRFQKEQFVAPTLGTNFSGDQFFTDGKTYLLFLR